MAPCDQRLEWPVSLRGDEPARMVEPPSAGRLVTPAISHEVDALESVIRKTCVAVHLVGHSFGALVVLAVALRNQVSSASLVILEAPAAELLRESGEDHHYRSFHQMTDAYFADYRGGNLNAISAMIDFYSGAGTFASWPPRVCAYAVQTTPVNILDWTSAYQFRSPSASLASVNVPALVIRGGTSHSAMQRANELVSEDMGAAALITIGGAAHFMIATHSEAVAQLVGQHAHRA